MKRLLLLLMALTLLVPGLARAAPPQISPDAYVTRLQRAIASYNAGQADAARREMGTTWEVALPSGPVTVDLRPVHALSNQDAVAALREHIGAFDAAMNATPADLATARQRLDKALAASKEQQETKNTIMDWLSRLWKRIFGGGGQVAVPAAPVREAGVPWITYVALGVGAVGIGVLGWNLWRSLSGNAAGSDVTLRPGRKGARPDRPLTPDELWELAGQEATAGDYKEGLRLAHLALLQHLDRSGLLRYIPAQTNREHEWLLRRKHPELARTMHQLNDLVESRLYSGHGATAEDFQRGETLARQLWREGDAQSTRNAQETSGASSSASSS